MGVKFYLEDERVMVIQASQTELLFRDLLDLVARHNLAHNSVLTRFIESLEYYYYGDYYPPRFEEIFLNRLPELEIFIQLLEEVVLEASSTQEDLRTYTITLEQTPEEKAAQVKPLVIEAISGKRVLDSYTQEQLTHLIQRLKVKLIEWEQLRKERESTLGNKSTHDSLKETR